MRHQRTKNCINFTINNHVFKIVCIMRPCVQKHNAYNRRLCDIAFVDKNKEIVKFSVSNMKNAINCITSNLNYDTMDVSIFKHEVKISDIVIQMNYKYSWLH